MTNPDEIEPTDANAYADERRTRIERAAYHIAESHRFEPDRELEDWLQAEQEIDEAGPQDRHLTRQNATSATGAPPPGHEEEGERIEPQEIKRWAQELNVSAEILREAILRTGPAVKNVKHFLQTHPHR